MGAGAVGVEILVDVEDEVGGGAVEVLDLEESGAGAVGDESGSVGPFVAGEEDLVAGGAGLADGGHGGLDGGGPGVDGDVVLGRGVSTEEACGSVGAFQRGTYGLVHKTESNLVVALVLGSDLRPNAGELSISRPALADNGAVPAGVVVEVDNAEGGAGIQAALDLLVVGGPVGRVKGATDLVVDKVLPANGDTESVEAVVVDEVLHLVETSLAGVDDVTDSASTVSAAAEVEASDLCDLSVMDR